MERVSQISTLHPTLFVTVGFSVVKKIQEFYLGMIDEENIELLLLEVLTRSHLP